MAGVLIGIILSFLVFYILTRITWVRIIKDKALRIQVHLPLLAICLRSSDERNQAEGAVNQEKGKGQRLGIGAYIRIASEILSHTKGCAIVIKRLILPCKTDDFGALTLVNPFAYQGLIYTAVAYFRTKARSLYLEDNAILSSPDISEIQFYITVKLRLLQLIRILLTLKRDVRKEKNRARGRKYVGE